MPEVLLVGSATNSLDELYALLVQAGADWTVRKIAGTDAALAQLELRPVDVLVAALGNDADAYQRFLGRVSTVVPRTLRFAMFDAGEVRPGKVAYAHQILAARENMHYVMPMLAAAAEVAARASTHPELQRIICQLHDVPSPPTLYFDIREQLDDLSGDLSGMAAATAQDPGLVARILKIANSGFYGVPRTISDLSEAVGMIGADALLGMVLAAHIYSGLPPPGLKLELLWQHTLRVSTLAKLITRHEGGSRAEQSVSAVAGLLHDIGIMVLLENEPARYEPLWRKSGGDERLLTQLERDAFGVSHGELGGLILMLWSLPEPVVAAVSHSHAAPHPGDVELPLTSRAVLGAESLLDNGNETSALEAVLELSGDTLAQWQGMRDEVLAQRLVF